MQISTTAEVVLAIMFKARSGNSGNAYVGDVTVAAAVGMELIPGESVDLSPSLVVARDTTVLLSDFYVDVATSGDDVDYIALVK